MTTPELSVQGSSVKTVPVWSVIRSGGPDTAGFPSPNTWYGLCSPRASMRGHGLRVLFVVVLIATASAIVVLSSGRLDERITWLANQPSGTSAFQHPESGRSDALIALISTAVLTPIAIFIVMVAFMFLVGMFEGVLVLVHLPDWLSAPVVGLVSVVAIYLTTSSWGPPSFSALTVVARAYIVFSHTSPPLFR